MPPPMAAGSPAGHRYSMSSPRTAGPRTALITVLAALLAAAFSLAACGDDNGSDPQAERDTRTTERSKRDRARSEEGIERQTQAIAEELKDLQREVVETGRKLVDGSAAGREEAERELRGHERRARQLAERVERDLGTDAPARAELRQAARQTEHGLEELRRFAAGDEDGLARANDQLEAAEESLRSVAGSLGRGSREEDVRRALDELRERVPEIPTR